MKKILFTGTVAVAALLPSLASAGVAYSPADPSVVHFDFAQFDTGQVTALLDTDLTHLANVQGDLLDEANVLTAAALLKMKDIVAEVGVPKSAALHLGLDDSGISTSKLEIDGVSYDIGTDELKLAREHLGLIDLPGYGGNLAHISEEPMVAYPHDSARIDAYHPAGLADRLKARIRTFGAAFFSKVDSLTAAGSPHRLMAGAT